jgi:hypothetical protein
MLSGQLTEEGSMRRAHTLRLAGPLAVTLPYKAIEDVMKVKGIKQGIFGRIKDHITVD